MKKIVNNQEKFVSEEGFISFFFFSNIIHTYLQLFVWKGKHEKCCLTNKKQGIINGPFLPKKKKTQQLSVSYTCTTVIKIISQGAEVCLQTSQNSTVALTHAAAGTL